MSFIDRLAGTEQPKISAHQFYSALIGLRDGIFTRTQLEDFFGISTSGADKTELDFVINTFNGATDKHRYVEAVHAVFMLLEHEEVSLTKTQIQSWLTAAAS